MSGLMEFRCGQDRKHEDREAYRRGYDRIFNAKHDDTTPLPEEEEEVTIDIYSDDIMKGNWVVSVPNENGDGDVELASGSISDIITIKPIKFKVKKRLADKLYLFRFRSTDEPYFNRDQFYTKKITMGNVGENNEQ